MTLDLEQLKQILTLVREHELNEFEIEHEGWRLKVRRESVAGSPPQAAQHAAAMAKAAAAGAPAGAIPAAAALTTGAAAPEAPDGS